MGCRAGVKTRQPEAGPPLLSLKAGLDRLYDEYNHADSAADPVHLVRPYRDRADREIAGFFAAALAFGRVAGLLEAVAESLAVLGPRPAAFVRRFDPVRDGRAFRRLGHRWIRGADLVALVAILKHMLDRAGSIEGFFLQGYDPAAPDLGSAVDSFARRALEIASVACGPRRPGVRFFFPRPAAGSACKRINLFLRWMVRQDAVDLGVWSSIPPAKLVIPLDTHVVRVGQCLGLTHLRTPGWRMAVEITAALRQLDPVDPVKYDFALCRLGMSGECGFGRAASSGICRFAGLCRGGSVAGQPRRARPRGGRREGAGPARAPHAVRTRS